MNKPKYKIFQDATQGYIEIEDKYVDSLIDTVYMQHEKHVSQVGIRSVYSGATHDRFSHSLGVYGIGKRIYRSVDEGVRAIVETSVFADAYTANFLDFYKTKIDEWLHDYEILFSVACILHDIGHPAYSHTLEYLYNDDYLNLGCDSLKKLPCIDDENYIKNPSCINEEETIRLLNRRQWIKKNLKADETYLENSFEKVLLKAEETNFGLKHKAAPHELMGAYQILATDKIRDKTTDLLEKKFYISNNKINDYLAFIARMITGCRYDIKSVLAANHTSTKKKKPSQEEVKLEYSLRNCIILLLNGSIDADSIDYLNRNSHFSGYATNNLDVTRLCNSFKVYFDNISKTFKPCLSKSALSSIDGFIQSRNFEPKWLYSHHKTVYFNEVLIEYLVKTGAIYKYEENLPVLEKNLVSVLVNKSEVFLPSIKKDELFLKTTYDEFIKTPSTAYTKDFSGYAKHISSEIQRLPHSSGASLSCAISISDVPIDNINYFGKDFVLFAQNRLSELIKNKSLNFSEAQEANNAIMIFAKNICTTIPDFKYIFINYILSPVIPFVCESGDSYFKTNDSGIETLLNSFYLSINNISAPDCIGNFRWDIFKKMVEEFKQREYRKSLWKSYDEYKLFIKSVADRFSISWKYVDNAFISLIKSVKGTSCCIEFEDINRISPKTSAGMRKEANCIYVNDFSDKSTLPADKKTSVGAFENIFSPLGPQMIIRLHDCKFKNFDKLDIMFNGWKIEKYGNISSYNTPENYIVPYIYFDPDYNNNNSEKSDNKTDWIKELGKRLEDYISQKINNDYSVSGGANMLNTELNNGVIIRDSVHGDIFVENKFLDIINTAAFQRLHKIRQLATANTVFPEAVHTRFAHSVGTYHIMRLMIDHFCNILDTLKIEYKKYDRDVILAAALLHDIGHGPYSHALEGLKTISGGKVKHHETWSVDIIENDAELQNVLKRNFDDVFAQQVISYLKKEDNEHNTLNKVFQDLISSNLDADRLDYLMRDSHNTGEKIGSFDLQKLISSMELTEYNGYIRVAINEHALPYVDQYILGRHHMYSSVYFSPFKLCTEELFRSLCQTVVMYTEENKFSSDDKVIEKIKEIKELTLYKLCAEKITVSEYLMLDDSTVENEIRKGLGLIYEATNETYYKSLYDSFMYRSSQFTQKKIGAGDTIIFDIFYNQLKNRFSYINELKSIIFIKGKCHAYKKGNANDEILIIANTGEVQPYSSVTKFTRDFNGEGKLFGEAYCYCYLNKALLEAELKKAGKETDMNKFEEVFDAYDLKKHIEIENKYHCDESTLDEIIRTVENYFEIDEKYAINAAKDCNQIDDYYDTDDFIIKNSGYSLRIRNKNSKYFLTIKKPGKVGSDEGETQFIRLEFENPVNTNDITASDSISLMNEYNLLNEIKKNNPNFDYKNLSKKIQIKNSRKTYYVTLKDSKDILFEIALDNVTFINVKDRATKKIFQIEIELKKDYTYRASLNEFASAFCKKFNVYADSGKPKLSKYIEALTLFNLD